MIRLVFVCLDEREKGRKNSSPVHIYQVAMNTKNEHMLTAAMQYFKSLSLMWKSQSVSEEMQNVSSCSNKLYVH